MFPTIWLTQECRGQQPERLQRAWEPTDKKYCDTKWILIYCYFAISTNRTYWGWCVTVNTLSYNIPQIRSQIEYINIYSVFRYAEETEIRRGHFEQASCRPERCAPPLGVVVVVALSLASRPLRHSATPPLRPQYNINYWFWTPPSVQTFANTSLVSINGWSQFLTIWLCLCLLLDGISRS